MPGRLVVVSTPIGNLGDLSARAGDTLREANLVLAEDTRRTGRLLAHLEADTPQWSLHEHNEDQRVAAVLERLEAGEVIALVSDAGTPTVSDPGYRLVAAAADAGYEVIAVPGPSAILHALATSGLPTDRFTFEGFLPRKGRPRRERLDEIAAERRTVVLFLSPHRADADLADLVTTCGPDRRAAVGRELTKLHEETVRGSLADLAARADGDGLRGELTLVIEGAAPPPAPDLDDTDLADLVQARIDAGMDHKEAVREVARDTDRPRREVYDAVVARRQKG